MELKRALILDKYLLYPIIIGYLFLQFILIVLGYYNNPDWIRNLKIAGSLFYFIVIIIIILMLRHFFNTAEKTKYIKSNEELIKFKKILLVTNIVYIIILITVFTALYIKTRTLT